MSRRRDALPSELPTQHLELVDPSKGPRVVRLTLAGSELLRQFGAADKVWRTTRARFEQPGQAFRAASAQVSRLLVRGYQLSWRNAELEAAIAAAPEDPAGYQVYADWLSSRGEPLGEYLSVCIALDQQPEDPVLMARERELYLAHALLLARPSWCPVRWRFGFVESVDTGLALEYCRAAAEDWCALPLRAASKLSSGRVYEYWMGQELLEALNSIHRMPMGAFVRRVHTGRSVYEARRVEASRGGRRRSTWELLRSGDRPRRSR